MILPIKDRFCAKFRVLANGCWKWTAARHVAGYGAFSAGGYAHRESYRLFVGEIPDGLHIHHKCHNKWCVNPGHLEALTRKQHYGEAHFDKINAIAERRRTATHCHNGHEFTLANTGINKFGRRWCKKCHANRTGERAIRCKKLIAEQRIARRMGQNFPR